MIQGVGQGGLASAAIEAALRKVAGNAAAVDSKLDGALQGALEAAGGGAKASFSETLAEGLKQIDGVVKGTDSLPVELLSGKVSDFHEVAGRIKQAEIAFKFSLEVRNKLIDAYRETMRMGV